MFSLAARWMVLVWTAAFAERGDLDLRFQNQSMAPYHLESDAALGLDASNHDGWVFQIVPEANPMLCYDLPSSGNGAPLWVWECNGMVGQLFFFDAGTYQIQWAGNPSKCLDGGSDMTKGNQLLLWDCNGLSQQKFGYDGDSHTIYLVDSAADASACVDLA